MDSNSDLVAKILQYYNNLTFYQKYNTDIWFTIIVITLVAFLIMYIFFLNSMKREKLNWEQNKCNPFYMLLGSQINNTDYAFNKDNLNSCLNKQTQSLTKKIFSPIEILFSLIQSLFAGLSTMFSIFMNHMAMLLSIMYRIFLMLMKKMIYIITVIGIEVNKLGNGLNKSLGGITNVYNVIVLTINNIKLILPMLAMAFFGLAVAPAIAIVGAIGFVVIALSVLCYFPLTGPIFCPILAVFVTALIIFIAYLLVVVIIYAISADSAQEILTSIERQERRMMGE